MSVTQNGTLPRSKNSKSSIWDLEEQFAFYGAYHTHKVNVAIHVICVPLIFWSSVCIFNKVMPWHTTIPVLAGPFKFNAILSFPFVYGLCYALYFIGLEPIAGAIYAPFVVFLSWSAQELYYKYANGWKIASVVFITCWIAQFIGHGKFEGRAPALFDSLFQSLVLAVFFVFMEVIFSLGYRPALHKRLQNRIGKEVLAYRQQKRREGKPDDKAVDQQTVWRG